MCVLWDLKCNCYESDLLIKAEIILRALVYKFSLAEPSSICMILKTLALGVCVFIRMYYVQPA